MDATLASPALRAGLLPANPPRFGPMTRRLLLRTGSLIALLAIAGTVLVFVTDSPHAKAAGLSLVFPGAGFLYDAWPILFVLTVVLFLAALVVWFGTGGITVPIAVYALGVAGSAAFGAGPRLFVDGGASWGWAIPVAYVCLAAVAAGGAYRVEKRYRADLKKLAANNAYLATNPVASAPSRPVPEPDETDSALARWAYGLALQPLDEFAGFDWIEQYQTAAVRYQLNALGYALALLEANLLPNYPSLVEQAQRNAIEKMTDLRIWRYWATENLLGNLSLNPDPMVKDNIMLSGFLGRQLGMYEAASGDHRYDEPGALPFVWKDGRVFAYDFPTIVDSLVRNFTANGMGLFACEPNWVYLPCNQHGGIAIKAYDVLHGTAYWNRVEPNFRKGLLEELMTADGAFVSIRSNRTGITFDWNPGGNASYMGFLGIGEALVPDLAERAFLIGSRGLKAMAGAVKEGQLPMPVNPMLDYGNYRRSKVIHYAGIAAGARAAGEEALAQAALRGLERECRSDDPAGPPFTGSVAANLRVADVRWGTPLGTPGLVLRGYQAPKGPILASAPWPGVLVTKARSADGAGLDLVAEPNEAKPGEPQRLVLERLDPGRAYALDGADGAEFVADATGRAEVTVRLTGRTVLALRPR